jgi:hypothetical protein
VRELAVDYSCSLLLPPLGPVSLALQDSMQLFHKITGYLPCMNMFSGQGGSRAANHGMPSASSCPMTMCPALCFPPVDKSAKRVDGTRGNSPICVAGPRLCDSIMENKQDKLDQGKTKQKQKKIHKRRWRMITVPGVIPAK